MKPNLTPGPSFFQPFLWLQLKSYTTGPLISGCGLESSRPGGHNSAPETELSARLSLLVRAELDPVFILKIIKRVSGNKATSQGLFCSTSGPERAELCPEVVLIIKGEAEPQRRARVSKGRLPGKRVLCGLCGTLMVPKTFRDADGRAHTHTHSTDLWTEFGQRGSGSTSGLGETSSHSCRRKWASFFCPPRQLLSK